MARLTRVYTAVVLEVEIKKFRTHINPARPADNVTNSWAMLHTIVSDIA